MSSTVGAKWRTKKRKEKLSVFFQAWMWSSGSGKLRVMWNCCVSTPGVSVCVCVCVLSLKRLETWKDTNRLVSADFSFYYARKRKKNCEVKLLENQNSAACCINDFYCTLHIFLSSVSLSWLKDAPWYKRRPTFLKRRPIFSLGSILFIKSPGPRRSGKTRRCDCSSDFVSTISATFSPPWVEDFVQMRPEWLTALHLVHDDSAVTWLDPDADKVHQSLSHIIMLCLVFPLKAAVSPGILLTSGPASTSCYWNSSGQWHALARRALRGVLTPPPPTSCWANGNSWATRSCTTAF